jgi:hypothetical protein
MPAHRVHITEDLKFDLAAVYASKSEAAATQIRDALVSAIEMLDKGIWNDSLIKQHGISGTRFSFDFCSEYIFTFTIDTYRDERKQPFEEHYFLKNLLRKK